jgi:hypothetical protein
MLIKPASIKKRLLYALDRTVYGCNIFLIDGLCIKTLLSSTNLQQERSLEKERYKSSHRSTAREIRENCCLCYRIIFS